MTTSYSSIQASYTPFSRFVLRTPALSLNLLLDLFKDSETLNIKKLTALDDASFLDEAIFIASSDLFNAIQEHKNSIQEKSTISESIALLKYLIRMTSRTTPFGLFSGCSVGKIQEGASSVILQEKAHYKVQSRLDSEYLDNIVKVLLAEAPAMSLIEFHINNTLYKVGDTYRCIEYDIKDGFRTYRLSSFEATKALDIIVSEAEGSFLLDDVKKLISEFGTEEEVGLFVEQLVSSQFLLPAVEPGVTGAEILKDLLDQTKVLLNSGHHGTHLFLKGIADSLDQINALEAGSALTSYVRLKEYMDSKVPNSAKSTFQVDLYPKVLTCHISSAFVHDLLEAASVLLRCGPTQETDIMKKFRDEFYSRYEEEEVPLLEALDPDIGLSFLDQFSDSNEGQLIKGMDYTQRTASQHVSLSTFDLLMLNRFNHCIANGLTEIEIYESDLAYIPPNARKLPPVFHILFEVFRCTDEEQLSYLQVVGAHSGANYLGRFCHGSEEIYSLASEITRKEACLTPDYLLADVVHLPQPRLGNIVHRPTLSEYEIPIIAESALEKNNVIPLGDIMISMKGGGKVTLRSKKLNKKIRPVLTNAQNFGRTGIGIYRFLCMLQTAEHGDSHTFAWNSYFRSELFLPRVRYKNTIFSLARWLLTFSEIEHFYQKGNVQNLEGMAHIFGQRGIPRHVWIVKGDNKLLLDLHNEWALKILYAETKKNKVVVLNEYLYEADSALVNDQNGNFFTNEILMYFHESDN